MADYIIVGGGSAGCVLAARLSEDTNATVTLLEAGPRDTNMFIHLPVGFFKMTAGPLIWGYETAAGSEIDGRTMVYPQARVLGGGSSINAQVFTRGCPEDYDAWANEEGCEGWSFKDVQPYFKRSEGNDTLVDEYHGNAGPLGVSSGNPHPLTRTFVQAAQQAGIPFTADFNGGKQQGSGFYQTTTRNGRRSSTAVGYLKPVLDRSNLTVRTGVFVNRIVVKGNRAIGVEIIEKGKKVFIAADREVILTSGAIGSPKLLMLSGIGAADELKNLGINVVHDLPGVGQNLQDHMDVDVIAELSGSYGIDRYKKLRWQILAGLEYAAFGKGPVASNIVEGGAFWWGDEAEKTPDIQFHFLPGAGVEKGIGSVPGGNGCTLNSYHLRPRSRGTVKLRSSDARDAPIIDPNAFAEPYDLERAVDGIIISRDILKQPAFEPFIKREHLPGDGVNTRAECAAFARQHARSAYHPVGTCRMGTGEGAVVDPQLRVHGIDGLRVCDSSIMPRLISSNTNAATVMIGEKAADLIRRASN
ncbi:GMC family oxidoreductase N-terminal domain-containing protein [Phyllobacterium sp. YR531]|uniref:GMC family oxidoreductase n=1 Tax=Phyllobacterium sp. YR531 TaxID=1144343 RepID=UPI00026F7E5E|nr:GMC family oxidoreductase N-terminal domain-containing protein [Phyllobacterium sp. YR531]EJN04619.1 choline dehydrogenase-like flavoprotein [Phyllobacterium sp. YR531]